MRSAFAVAAFAAAAIAGPVIDNKRALEYDYDVAYVTNVVTVTAYGAAPTQPAKAPHYGHKSAPAPKPPVYQAPAPVQEAPAPAPVEEAPAAESTAPSTAPTYTAPSSDSHPTDYKSAVLAAHNWHRSNHSVDALEWSDELEDCARTVAQTCRYEHDVSAGGGGYGQNIAAGVAADNITVVITDMFYNGEEPLYAPFYGQEPVMDNFEEWGHVTQLLWKDTTHVACVSYDCSSTGLANTGDGVSPWFIVCNYKGPGNYAGQYAENVLPPKGMPTIDWSATAYA